MNYASGEYLVECVDSLRALDRGHELEIVVVDCASPVDQTRAFAAVGLRGVRVIQLTENRGYAGGCNAGVAATRGRYVILSNPDLVVQAGCIGALIDVIERSEDVAFVAPCSFLDDDLHFQVPTFELLTRTGLFVECMYAASRRLALRASFTRSRARLSFWKSRTQTQHDCLPGAFLATRRATFEELGGFDEGFALYYEDTDLFRRTRDAGYRLVIVPDAVVVHYAHRSSLKVWSVAMAKLRRGRRRFLRKHMGPLSALCDTVMFPMTVWLFQIRRTRTLDQFEDLGETVDSPAIEWGGAEIDYVIELAFDANFLEATGSWGRGSSFCFSAATWRSLADVPFYVRVLELPGFRERGRWCVQKS